MKKMGRVPIIEGLEEGSFCCGVSELSGFCSEREDYTKIVTVDEEWFKTLANAVGGYYGTGTLSAIIHFAHAAYQGRNKYNPKVFAKWLREQGESVVETPWAHNSNSGNKIKSFLWTPSSKFRKKLQIYLDKAKEEKEKENAKWHKYNW